MTISGAVTMDEHNPYRSPDAPIVDSARTPDGALPLAGRFERLMASILDTILLLATALPPMFFFGYFEFIEENVDIAETIAIRVGMAFLVFVLFAAMQAYPLRKNGQTWGKVAMKIRIVDMQGRKPDFWRMLALRYLPFDMATPVPVVGSIVGLVDTLMIFRGDRRCAHDLLAGTRVVAIGRKDAPRTPNPYRV